MEARNKGLDAYLASVRRLMAGALGETVLRRLVSDQSKLFGSGKMLRSRLLWRVGTAANVDGATLLHAAAAVEMIHAASLLHDDVIDGGYIRRNLPTFWVERGISGAILVGDLLLFKALDVVGRVADGRLVRELVKLTGEVCDAESEQELVLRGLPPTWENCVAIARRKTGALFAFAALASGGSDTVLCATLKESGYAVGTAYQLADDILDVNGTEDEAGKTLGTDAARSKTTAMSAAAGTGIDPIGYIEALCREATRALELWPHIHEAWQGFMDEDIRPTVDSTLSAFIRS